MIQLIFPLIGLSFAPPQNILTHCPQFISTHGRHSLTLESQIKNYMTRDGAFITQEAPTPPLFKFSKNGQTARGLVAQQEPIIQSMRFHSAYGRIIPASEYLLLLLHGYGADYSHSGAMIEPLRTFLASNKVQKKLVQAYEYKNKKLPLVSAEAIDLPYSGFGYGNNYHANNTDIPFGTLESTSNFLTNYLKALQSLDPSLPLVPITRSASVGLAAQLNWQNPQLFDGMIFIGPLHPDPKIGFTYSCENYEAMVNATEFEPNRDGYNWVNQMYSEMTWHLENAPSLQDTPTLILIGENDKEVSPEAKEWFKNLAKQHHHITFFEVPGGAHDVLSSIKNYSPFVAYLKIYEFLETVKVAKSVASER